MKCNYEFLELNIIKCVQLNVFNDVKSTECIELYDVIIVTKLK